MKLFYFLDFMHVKKYGLPITYDTYINLEHGPIPSGIKNLVDTAADDVDSSILADTIAFETPEGTEMKRMVPRREFTKEDSKLFSPSELDILNYVCKRFSDKNTKYIEEASHDEAPWRETKMFETIPYTLAAKDVDSKYSEEELKMIAKL